MQPLQNVPEFLDALSELARSAGAVVMAVYATDFDVRGKGDASPVTEADLAADAVISSGLRAAFPQVPLINVKTGVPTQFFMDYMNTLNSKLTNAVQALNNAVDGLLAAQAQSVAQQAQVITQAQSVATAQGQADAAAGSPAQSGDAMGVISVPAGAGWTAGPQVDLLGVIAGSLSVINSGPSQISASSQQKSTIWPHHSLRLTMSEPSTSWPRDAADCKIRPLPQLGS